MYYLLGQEFVPFNECEVLFRESPETRQCLSSLYDDLLRFEAAVARLFGRSCKLILLIGYQDKTYIKSIPQTWCWIH